MLSKVIYFLLVVIAFECIMSHSSMVGIYCYENSIPPGPSPPKQPTQGLECSVSIPYLLSCLFLCSNGCCK